MNHWDRFWESRASADDFYPQHERIERVLHDIGGWKGQHGVEIGCGAGSGGRLMLNVGLKPILLDYSQASLDKCRQQYPAGGEVVLVRGDAFHLPFKDGSFSVLFHQGLIEHFPGDGPNHILRENLRVLKPDGWLVVDVPQALHPEGIFSRPFIWTGKWFAGWQTYYTFPRLKCLATSLGLEEIRYFGGWMNPSFWYRALRWVLRPLFLMPLHPPSLPILARIRQRSRHRFFYHPLALWTGASIGFAARKPKISTTQKT